MYSELSFDEAYELGMNGPDDGIGALYAPGYMHTNGGVVGSGEGDGTKDFAEEGLVIVVEEEKSPVSTEKFVGSMLTRRYVMKVGGRDRLILDAELPEEAEQTAA